MRPPGQAGYSEDSPFHIRVGRHTWPEVFAVVRGAFIISTSVAASALRAASGLYALADDAEAAASVASAAREAGADGGGGLSAGLLPKGKKKKKKKKRKWMLDADEELDW